MELLFNGKIPRLELKDLLYCTLAGENGTRLRFINDPLSTLVYRKGLLTYVGQIWLYRSFMTVLEEGNHELHDRY